MHLAYLFRDELQKDVFERKLPAVDLENGQFFLDEPYDDIVAQVPVGGRFDEERSHRILSVVLPDHQNAVQTGYHIRGARRLPGVAHLDTGNGGLREADAEILGGVDGTELAAVDDADSVRITVRSAPSS